MLSTLLIAGLSLGSALVAHADPFKLSYSGRLTTADGAAIEGPVDLSIEFFRDAAGGAAVMPAVPILGVSLKYGVFQVEVDLTDSERQLVFNGNDPVWIQVTADGRKYPRQKYSAVPYALKVPTDGKTISFNDDGYLRVGPATGPASGEFLTADGSGNFIWATPDAAPASTVQSFASDPGLAPGDQGQVWYRTDTKEMKYWDGTTVKTLGVSGAGLTNLNGQTGGAQTLSVAPGAAVLTPGWLSAGDAHTLQIPYANAIGVTGGLISKADYDAFNAKQAALGFTPVNKAGDTMGGVLAMGANKITGVTDPTAAQDAATKNYVDTGLATKQTTLGFTPVNKAGDTMAGVLAMGANKITGVTDPTAAQDAATKNYVDTGLTAGLATKENALGFTPVNKAGDTMGGVLAMGANKITGVTDPTAAQDAATKNYVDTGLATKQGSLGFTPVNKAGDVLVGPLGLGAYTNAEETTLLGTLIAGDEGKAWYNSQTNEIKYWNGTAAVVLGAAGSGLGNFNGETAASQTLDIATGAAVTLPTWASAFGNHELQFPDAADAGVTAGLLSKADYDSFAGKQTALGFTPVNKAGDTMGGVLAMGANKITGVTDPTAAQDAATKNYVDTGLATKQTAIGYTPVNKAGDTMGGVLAMGANKITGVTDPTAAQDAATKNYVDTSLTTGLATKQNSLGFTPVNQAGDTMGGVLAMGANKITGVTDPTAAQDAATKNYVDTSLTTGLATKQNSLGFTAVNKAGDVLTGPLGLGSYTNAQETTLTGGLVAGDEGKAWYNSQTNEIKYWNGSAPVVLGAAGSGLGNFNGQTGTTQGLGITTGAAVNLPTWLSAADIHTLQFPNASAAGVTAGLISKTDYDSFAGKQAPLGFTPVNKAGDTMGGVLAMGANKITGVTDPTAAQDAATKNYVDTGLATKQTAIGYTPVNKAGDTMGGVLAMGANKITGVTDPTAAQDAATKNYVDTSLTTGLATKQNSLGFTPVNKAGDTMGGALAMGTFKVTGVGEPTAAQDAATKNYVDTGLGTKQATLGFTPVNKAGDVLSGPLGLGAYATAQETTLIGTLVAGDEGKAWYNSQTNEIKYWNGTAAVVLGAAGSGLGNFNGETAASQTLDIATGAAVTLPTWASAFGNHELQFPDAADAGVTAGLISKTDYDSFAGKQPALGFTPVNKAGDTMSGVLAMGANKITGVTDPTAAQDAATKNYVDTGLATKQTAIGYTPVNKAGDTMGGVLAMGANKITGVTDPTAAQDAATKNYVDTGLATKQGSLGFTPVNKAGDTMGGVLAMGANKITGVTDPTAAQDAATKNYVDTSLTTGLATKQNSLGFSPVNKAGDVLLGPLGLGAYTNAQETTLVGTLVAGDEGKAWYNSQSNEIKYWNGTAAVVLGAAGTGLNSLNGESGVAQTLDVAVGAAVTLPTWASAFGNHELQFPNASAVGVTGGLITKAQFDTFNDKQAALGYTPVNKAGDTMGGALAMGTFKVTGVGEPTAAQDAATKNYVDVGLATKQNSIGYTAVNKAGDTMGGALAMGTNKITGVGDPTAAQDAATKNYVDTELVAKQDALGFMPLSESGGTMTGALNLPANGLIVGTNQLAVDGGNVGVGTATPGAKLEVAGQVKITGGTPGAGKVLTSDASGLAVWDVPPGGDLSYSSSASSPNDAVYVNNTGNVGIGTTTPETSLHVAGPISTGGGGIKWKVFSGTTAAADSTAFAHGLAAGNIVSFSCVVKHNGGTTYVPMTMAIGALNRYVTFTGTNATITHNGDTLYHNQQYRCVAQYIDAVPAVDGFSAVTGTNLAGDIRITIDFPGDTSTYDHVEVRRIAGATAPSAACTNGTDNITNFVTFGDTTYVDSFASDGLVGGTVHSYRLCVFGTDGSVNSFAIAQNVAAKLPANLSGFSAVQGIGTQGTIDLTIDFPAAGETASYSKVEIRRIAGATPPVATCNGGSDNVRQYTTYTDVNPTDSGLVHSTYYSYRVCVFGIDGSLVSTTTVANVRAKPDKHIFFATSGTYQGNLGGVAGADAICTSVANGAGLVGNYKAVLSSPTANARDRISVTSTVYTVGNVQIWTGAADMWDGSTIGANLVNKSQTNASVSGNVWTGTSPTGYLDNDTAFDTMCDNWTTNASNKDAEFGSLPSTNDDWISLTDLECNQSMHLYCISQ